MPLLVFLWGILPHAHKFQNIFETFFLPLEKNIQRDLEALEKKRERLEAHQQCTYQSLLCNTEHIKASSTLTPIQKQFLNRTHEELEAISIWVALIETLKEIAHQSPHPSAFLQNAVRKKPKNADHITLIQAQQMIKGILKSQFPPLKDIEGIHQVFDKIKTQENFQNIVWKQPNWLCDLLLCPAPIFHHILVLYSDLSFHGGSKDRLQSLSHLAIALTCINNILFDSRRLDHNTSVFWQGYLNDLLTINQVADYIMVYNLDVHSKLFSSLFLFGIGDFNEDMLIDNIGEKNLPFVYFSANAYTQLIWPAYYHQYLTPYGPFCVWTSFRDLIIKPTLKMMKSKKRAQNDLKSILKHVFAYDIEQSFEIEKIHQVRFRWFRLWARLAYKYCDKSLVDKLLDFFIQKIEVLKIASIKKLGVVKITPLTYGDIVERYRNQGTLSTDLLASIEKQDVYKELETSYDHIISNLRNIAKSERRKTGNVVIKWIGSLRDQWDDMIENPGKFFTLHSVQ